MVIFCEELGRNSKKLRHADTKTMMIQSSITEVRVESFLVLVTLLGIKTVVAKWESKPDMA